MKTIVLDTDGGWGGGSVAVFDFDRSFGDEPNWIDGFVAPVCFWGEKETGWNFLAKKDNGSMEGYDEALSRTMFKFSYCWRGVWESRIYPGEEEYWGTELRTMWETWQELVPHLVKELQSVNTYAREDGAEDQNIY